MIWRTNASAARVSRAPRVFSNKLEFAGCLIWITSSARHPHTYASGAYSCEFREVPWLSGQLHRSTVPFFLRYPLIPSLDHSAYVQRVVETDPKSPFFIGTADWQSSRTDQTVHCTSFPPSEGRVRLWLCMYDSRFIKFCFNTLIVPYPSGWIHYLFKERLQSK